MIADVVVALLGLVASLAPGVLAALSGRGTDAEAITEARRLTEALPVRSGPGGEHAEDLGRRERGEP